MIDRTAFEWARRLGLKRQGSEYVGPCPICGGTDRFHVRDRPGGGALVGSRICIDGLPKDAGRKHYAEIVRHVWGDEEAERSEERKVVSEAHRRARRRAAREEAKRARNAARKAQRMLDRATYDTHDYLIAKGFPEVRAWVLDGELLVPARTARNRLLSVQRIDADGVKKFLWGSKIADAHGRYTIGRSRDRSWIVEGLATGLSVLMTLNAMQQRNPCVKVAFMASNLPNVAGPRDIVIADHDTDGKGQLYAERSGRPFWLPPDVGQDANDFHAQHGINALANELRPLLRER